MGSQREQARGGSPVPRCKRWYPIQQPCWSVRLPAREAAAVLRTHLERAAPGDRRGTPSRRGAPLCPVCCCLLLLLCSMQQVGLLPTMPFSRALRLLQGKQHRTPQTESACARLAAIAAQLDNTVHTHHAQPAQVSCTQRQAQRRGVSCHQLPGAPGGSCSSVHSCLLRCSILAYRCCGARGLALTRLLRAFDPSPHAS